MYGRQPVDRLVGRLSADGQGTVLFLSRHGSARALIAESIVNHHAAGGFAAISAGAEPEDEAHPFARELLRAFRLPAPHQGPASLQEVVDQAEREFDYVVALWDRASGEPFPTAHRDAVAACWDIPDPRRFSDPGAGLVASRVGFVRAYTALRTKIEQFFADISAEQSQADRRILGLEKRKRVSKNRRNGAPRPIDIREIEAIQTKGRHTSAPSQISTAGRLSQPVRAALPRQGARNGSSGSLTDTSQPTLALSQLHSEPPRR